MGALLIRRNLHFNILITSTESYVHKIFSKDGVIHDLYEYVAAKVIPAEFAILNRFFMSVAILKVEAGGSGIGKR